MLDVRQLADADLSAARKLSATAFGWRPSSDAPPPVAASPDARIRWGAFDESGTLVAQAVDLVHEQWWGGRVLAASGVASVAVAPEHRGRGASRAVMSTLLHSARDRGAAVAALFCTSSAVYRSLGFEVCGALRTVTLPTAVLDRRAAPSTVRLRGGDGTDWPLVRAVYDEIARTGNGFLSRRGPLFADPDGDALPDGLDGLTVAEDAATGQVVGYTLFERGSGYGDDSYLHVYDCLALTADAARALLAGLASWGPVAPTLRLRLTPWPDAVAAQLPVERLREQHVDVWMHRPLDVAAAVSGRGWSPVVDGSVAFQLVDRTMPANDGAWRLTVSAGHGVLETAGGQPAATLDVRGWSLLWSGAARAAQLRQAGLLAGGGPADDAGLDALLGGGGPSGFLDYF